MAQFSIFKLAIALKSSIYYFLLFYETQQKTIQQINFGFPPGNARCVPRLLNSPILGTRAI